MSANLIRFVLNGEIVEARVEDPTKTVLQFLREDRRLKGTKEGCAEGDCGACTVVVLEEDAGDLRLRTVNSCIRFLPTLDGKELITVEGLRSDDGGLHAVQQAMVDAHGSQCSRCTARTRRRRAAISMMPCRATYAAARAIVRSSQLHRRCMRSPMIGTSRRALPHCAPLRERAISP